MNGKIKYQFSGELWRDKVNTWYFVTIPKEYSNEIRNNLQFQEEGWGRMRAKASIKELNWDTAIWFDSKSQNYLLPIKAEIRKKLALKENDLLETTVYV